MEILQCYEKLKREQQKVQQLLTENHQMEKELVEEKLKSAELQQQVEAKWYPYTLIKPCGIRIWITQCVFCLIYILTPNPTCMYTESDKYVSCHLHKTGIEQMCELL